MPSHDILDALDTVLRDGEPLGPIVGAFFQLARSVDDDTRTQMLASLDERIAAYPVDRVGELAMLAGALVELGAHTSCFPSSVFDHLHSQLGTIDSPDDETELPDAYYLMERAAIACLSRSVELRKTLPQKPLLLASLRRYEERYGFIGKMIQVLDDEELLVLHLPTRRGFRCTIRGVGDNFQLHVLILAAMAETGIAGPAPAPEIIAAATDSTAPRELIAESDWQLKNWHGLTETDSNESWIWNEGVPADIAMLDGARLVLVEPSKIHRSWNAQRVFPSMVATVTARSVLSRPDVDNLLAAIRSRATA